MEESFLPAMEACMSESALEKGLASTHESWREKTCVLFHLRDNPLCDAQGLGTSAV